MKFIKAFAAIFILFFAKQNIAIAQLKEVYREGRIELNTGEIKNGFIKEDDLQKLTFKIRFKNLESDISSGLVQLWYDLVGK